MKTRIEEVVKRQLAKINNSKTIQMEQERKWDYSRLVKRYEEISLLYRETLNDEYLIEDHCIAHLFECEGLKNYETIALFCEEHDIKRVVDIGCAYGHQSEVFLQTNIDYIGVNDTQLDFWNKEHFQYVTGAYPCELPLKKGDLGISVLCLTWNCYLYEKEKTLINQCEALQKDFEHCLIYVQPDHLKVISKYFKNIHHIKGNFYYFSN